MASPQGSRGTVEVFDDFLAPDNDLTWGAGTIKVGNFGFVSVNEGTLEWVVDEPGGIVQVTTDTADNDNACFMAGAFKPADGPLVLEARLKIADITTDALFVGFTETLSLATPVMPAEFATATMTYNGSGGMVGAQFDADGTTDDWRAVMGDGGVATGGSGNGVAAGDPPVNDEWTVVRVELNTDGSADVYVGHSGDLKLVKSFTAGLTPTDVFYGVVMVENRSAAASVLEVDYIEVCGNRDWSV